MEFQMKYLTIPEAHAILANLIERVCAGEEIIFTKDGVPAVRMEAITRPLGIDRDSLQIADDFDAPLPPDILTGFLGEEPSSESTKAKPSAKAKQKRRKNR